MKRLYYALIISASFLGLSIAVPGIVIADYPSKPITIVAPWAPGGATDLAARTLAAVAPSYLSQPVVVINKTGAGGITGSSYVNKKRPDGYTLVLTRPASVTVVPVVNKKVVYKWDSWTILGILELNPFVFVVNSKSSYKTLDDLLAAVRDKPGQLTYSHSGPSTVLALSAQMLLQLGGLKPQDATGIPYKGGGPSKVALLGGHVDFLGINLSAVIDQIKGGKLRALAVTTKERFAAIPDVPTVSEAGYPELVNLIPWSGLYGPPNLPAEVVDKWTKALQGVKKDKAWNKITKSLGSIPYVLPPQEAKKFAKQQYDMYSQLCSSLGLIIK